MQYEHSFIERAARASKILSAFLNLSASHPFIFGKYFLKRFIYGAQHVYLQIFSAFKRHIGCIDMIPRYFRRTVFVILSKTPSKNVPLWLLLRVSLTSGRMKIR